MPEAMSIPATFAASIRIFAECFTAPSFGSFWRLVTGWVLCTSRHTVTGVIRSAWAVGDKHHDSFHRFFREGRWEPDAVGLCVLKLVMALVDREGPVVVALDDTLARHTGKRIRGAAMHRDPLLSTRVRPVFHFGHVWVVMSIVVRVERWNKVFALPVLVCLYRPKKLCKKTGRPFFKKTELAAQMLDKLAKALHTREICVVADSDYGNGSVVKRLPENVHFIGRGRPDAALYALPKPQRMGRPRVKGERLPSPEARARSSRGWKRIEVEVYGRTAVVNVKVFDALWYKVSGGRMLRFVLVRGWPGHDHDDVFCTTDLALDAEQVITRYCLRWSIEVTFEETKGKLGFEDPQNRTEHAVERTAPMALWTYSLVVLWYVRHGHRLSVGRVVSFAWHQKTVPAFSDMLAALRREIWRYRVLDPLHLSRRDQKSLEPLVEAAAMAA